MLANPKSGQDPTQPLLSTVGESKNPHTVKKWVSVFCLLLTTGCTAGAVFAARAKSKASDAAQNALLTMPPEELRFGYKTGGRGTDSCDLQRPDRSNAPSCVVPCPIDPLGKNFEIFSGQVVAVTGEKLIPPQVKTLQKACTQPCINADATLREGIQLSAPNGEVAIQPGCHQVEVGIYLFAALAAGTTAAASALGACYAASKGFFSNSEDNHAAEVGNVQVSPVV